MEEDVGLSDGNEANSKRRGRQGRSGPMGDRVSPAFFRLLWPHESRRTRERT